MTKEENGFVDGYIESMLPEIVSIIQKAYLVGFETGDGIGYQRGRQEGYDMESELAQQFGGKLFKEVK